MCRSRRAIALSLIVGTAVCLPVAAADSQTDVPVRKVVLFSSGVGYFQHGGTVTDDATTELRFKSAQINDVLKSLVLEDLDGGQVGTVVYPSHDPLSKTLRSFQVDLSGTPTLPELLAQLRGAEVEISVQGEGMSGVILGVEARTKTNLESEIIEEAWWLNLLSEGTIRSGPLEDIGAIELQDPQLREELSKALHAVAQARDQDKKPVTIGFNGQGQRRVRLGYVVETPIWKTTYRLIMPAGQEETGKLQGWAIVENQTESDWNEVSLSLVSGRPISFIQNLYQPLYVPRPVVEPELYASLAPQAYGAGMELDDRRAGGLGGRKVNAFGAVAEDAKRPPNAARRIAKAMAPQAERLGVDAYARGDELAGEPALNAAASITSLAAAADVGELFQYTVPAVSLPRQRSAMIPIITDDIEVERLSIYNQQVQAKHPLNGALLNNTTGKHLLQGPLTVFDEGGYAGDARIEDLPPDQHRLLSYALDLDVQVNATKVREHSTLQTGRLVKGVLHLKRKHVFKQEYAIDNQGDKDRTMLVEHSFRRGWKLVDTPKPFESTDRLHRFKDAVAAGEKSTLSVTEEKVRSETIAILPADIGQIEFYTRAGEIPDKVRKALARAIELKSALVDTQRQIKDRQKRINEITSEQERIRSNMKTVRERSEYYTRLLTKLNDQETTIEGLQQQIKGLQETLNRQRAALEDYLRNLNVG